MKFLYIQPGNWCSYNGKDYKKLNNTTALEDGDEDRSVQFMPSFQVASIPQPKPLEKKKKISKKELIETLPPPVNEVELEEEKDFLEELDG